MIIDFHSHSNASDGELSPIELIASAIRAGVNQFAITDHDTVAGYRQAREHYKELPEDFILLSGVELSCQWSATTVHVVGLGVDVDNPVLAKGLAGLESARFQRGETIATRLAKAGFPGALEGAMEQAGDSQLGRPHFAAWLVEQGHVSNASAAFDKYLGSGRMGDVKTFWPGLEEVTSWLVQAGGHAVMAHPLKYRFTRMKLRRLLQDFCTAGGTGLEVYSGRQADDQTRHLCQTAREFGLSISAGSDFHREWEYGPGLGVDVRTLPAQPALWREAV